MKISKGPCADNTVRAVTIKSGDCFKAKAQYANDDIRFYMAIGASGGSSCTAVNIESGKRRSFSASARVTPVNASVCIEEAS